MIPTTKIIELIKYHSNTDLENIIKNDEKFNPNAILRKKHSLICVAVSNNNFDIFKLLINHSKFNYEPLSFLEGELNYVYLILKRVNMCDIFENRRYLNELYKINHSLNVSPLNVINNIFEEVFEKLDKTNFTYIYNLCYKNIDDIPIFQRIFNYIREIFPNQLTKELVDRFLKYGFNTDNANILKILKDANYDISKCYNIDSSLCNLHDKSFTNCINFLKDNVIYNSNLIDSVINTCKSTANFFDKIEYIVQNYDSFELMYKTINNDTQNQNIIIIMIENILTNRHKYTRNTYNNHNYFMMVKILIEKKIISKNPFEALNVTIINKILNSYYNIDELYVDQESRKLIKHMFLWLINYNFKPTIQMNELMKKMFGDEINNLEELAKNDQVMLDFNKKDKKKQIIL